MTTQKGAKRWVAWLARKPCSGDDGQMWVKFKRVQRRNDPGHAHALTFSCFHRQRWLAEPKVGDLLIEALDRARHRHDFDLWAYVIMPDHVLLLLYPNRSNYYISTILAAIKRPVAFRAKRLLHQSNSPFWQRGGGYDRNLHGPEAVHAEIAYIHANPVRGGLCQHPEEYRLSSAAFWFGKQDVPLAMDQSVPPLPP